MSYVSTLFPKIIEHFAPILEQKSFPKATVLQEADRACSHLYLVAQGGLRAYYYKDHRDITAHFAFAREAITAPQGFILGKASKHYIETLEDSRVWVVHNQALEDFLEQHSALERLARKFTQAIYLELLERVESLVFLTAQERYQSLLDRNPRLLLQVNLGHIASYLGITQETLSRIRAK